MHASHLCNLQCRVLHCAPLHADCNIWIHSLVYSQAPHTLSPHVHEAALGQPRPSSPCPAVYSHGHCQFWKINLVTKSSMQLKQRWSSCYTDCVWTLCHETSRCWSTSMQAHVQHAMQRATLCMVDGTSASWSYDGTWHFRSNASSKLVSGLSIYVANNAARGHTVGASCTTYAHVKAESLHCTRNVV